LGSIIRVMCDLDPGIDRVDRLLLELSRVDGEAKSRVDRSSRSHARVVESAEKTRRSQLSTYVSPLGNIENGKPISEPVFDHHQ
jgi:hypothetical protein